MGLRFQRRITLFPGVRLNFSRHGISTSIGPRGASITLGHHGAALNLGIPGTGLSLRQQLTPRHPGQPVPVAPPVEPPSLPRSPLLGSAIESAPVSEVTSQGLESLKALMKEAFAERAALRQTIPQTRQELAVAEQRLRRAKNWFFKLFIGKQAPQRQAAVGEKAAELKSQEERLAGAVIDAKFTLDEPTVNAFNALTETFEHLASCQTIWDVTREHFEDTRVTRSSASRNVVREPVRFDVPEDSVLLSDAKVLRLRNANGADLLIYPGFMMLVGGADLGLVELRDIELTCSMVKFTETDSIPSDATVVGHTWAKCNKDGSPDRRFKGNYQIPVVGYGQLVLKSPSGVSEEFLVSGAEKAMRFAEAYSDYKRKLRELSVRGPVAGGETQPALAGKELAEPPYEWKSISFLQASDAASAEHTIELLERFVGMLKSDIDGFSGKRSMTTTEKFINTLASAPGVVRRFLDRSPSVAPFASKITASVTDIARDAVAQVRQSIERAGSATAAEPETQSALRAAREAERALRA